jgi:hypothetical protein
MHTYIHTYIYIHVYILYVDTKIDVLLHEHALVSCACYRIECKTAGDSERRREEQREKVPGGKSSLQHATLNISLTHSERVWLSMANVGKQGVGKEP